jgi:hypothetical protein
MAVFSKSWRISAGNDSQRQPWGCPLCGGGRGWRLRWPRAAAWVVLAVAWREQGRYLCFGSATPPTGCAVDSNRLASISKFATAHDRNPERRQQARAGDWCERDLHFPAFRKIFDKRVPARWPAIGRSTKVRNHRRMVGCMLIIGSDIEHLLFGDRIGHALRHRARFLRTVAPVLWII